MSDYGAFRERHLPSETPEKREARVSQGVTMLSIRVELTHAIVKGCADFLI